MNLPLLLFVADLLIVPPLTCKDAQLNQAHAVGHVTGVQGRNRCQAVQLGRAERGSMSPMMQNAAVS